MATEPRVVETQTLTPKQAAAILGVHVETIRRMTRRGELSSVKVGVSTRIPRRVIEALLNGDQPQSEAVPGAG